MSIARHHAEWLSLIETSGPFASMPVLQRIFPQGLDPRGTAQAKLLREGYEDWLDNGQESAAHQVWVRQVLAGPLEYPDDLLLEGQSIPPGMEVKMAEFGETLRPDLVLKSPDETAKPTVLIQIIPPEQDLDKPVPDKIWKASPSTRMMELLHGAEVQLGLVTNGEHWMLVNAPRGETTGYASWYADLWMQEPLTLRAFHSLLGTRRLFGVAPEETLPELLNESAKDQQEVTDQLGYQVRAAVEMIVQAIDRADAESGRQLLANVDEKTLYEASLTVMMRLVFLFSAEERDLIAVSDRNFYDEHYAVSTLREQLRAEPDEEVLARRHDAWFRFLATCRAVHGGVEHSSLRLPPYGGNLFDPNRFPFLEGRSAGSRWQDTPAQPIQINNQVVLHMLEALQILRVKVPGGGPAEAQRLSFRSLDIEQIGHVYEGLLDHTVKRANEVVLGLVGKKGDEPEIPLSVLEDHLAEGADKLLEFLKSETGKTLKALGKLLEAADGSEAEEKPKRGRGKVKLPDDHELLIACGQDTRLRDRIKPFAGFLRVDDYGQLIIIGAGSLYVTAGSDRRSTGTHYTPRSLTEPIVQHTLEPLVYEGPAEGKPKEEWKLKSPKEILELKVCDMAMGSGAFLVQTCRYLADRLVEAWELAEQANPGKILATPEGDFSEADPRERLIPQDAEERIAIARRFVADRCLYGVDINPWAVEMAKLSIWLITMQRDRPFNFLNHSFKCGDSLLGVSDFKQIENFSLREGAQQITFATSNLFRYVEDAIEKRQKLEQMPSNDHGQIEVKNSLHVEAENATRKVKALADSLVAFELFGLDGNSYEEHRTVAADHAEAAMHQPLQMFETHAREQLNGRRPFHWPLEYPEIYISGGFSAVIGNPPFISYYSRQSVKEEVEFAQNIAKTFTFSSVSSANRRFNSAMFFWERGLQISRPQGIVGLLNDMNFLENSFTPIREWLRHRHSPEFMIHGLKAFANVASGQVFLSVSNESPSGNSALITRHGLFGKEEMVQLSEISERNNYNFTPPVITFDLEGRPLKDLLKVNVGVVFSGSTDKFLTNGPESEFSWPYLASGGLKEKYQPTLNSTHYITFSQALCDEVNSGFKAMGKKNVAVLGKIERFSEHKIVVRQSAPELIATIDTSGIVCPLNYFTINSKGSSIDLYYVLAILNSDTLSGYARESGIIRMGAGKQPQIRKSGLDSLPIPLPDDLSLMREVSALSKALLQADRDFNKDQAIAELERLVDRCFERHNESSSFDRIKSGVDNSLKSKARKKSKHSHEQDELF